MKKTIFLMAMLLALSAAAPMASAAPQSHRNRPHTQMVDKKDKDATDEEGVVAYSDTVTADTASAANGGATFDNDAPVSRDELLSFYNSLPGWIVKLFLIVCVFVPMLLCFLAPIIVVLLVIRYFMRRHKDRVRLAEMAMEKGEPFTDELKPLSKKSPEYMWRRGVRNTSIGAGLMIFFWFFGMQSLMGIGALVACIGLGQMFMVKYNYDSKMPWQKRDDLAQDTFIRAYTSIGTFRGSAAFSTWLFRIAYNVFYDYRHRLRPSADDLDAVCPAAAGADRSLGMDVYGALARLPDAERTCVTLQLVDGYPIERIAAITGMAEGTVKSHLFRGKQKLTAFLRQNGYS